VSLGKLLKLNANIVGLRAASRLLDRTQLVLPPRPHLRWISNVTGHPNFQQLLIQFLQVSREKPSGSNRQNSPIPPGQRRSDAAALRPCLLAALPPCGLASLRHRAVT
jgi:hypothetical protein